MKIRVFVIAAINPTSVYVREKNTGQNPVPVMHLPALGKIVTSTREDVHFENYPITVRNSVEKFFKQVQAMPEADRKAFIENTKPWEVRARGE